MANVYEVKDKVSRYLTKELNGVTIDSDGDFSFRIDSARVFVGVNEWAETHVIVRIFAIVLEGVALTQELKDHVLFEGSSYYFGTLQLETRDDGLVNLIFRHNILGDFLDEEELMIACQAVGGFAEEEDDVLQQRFGGQRFHEESDD